MKWGTLIIFFLMIDSMFNPTSRFTTERVSIASDGESMVERVSVASDGTRGNSHSGENGVSISADGRYVMFASYASNLVPGDTNGVSDVFVRDRQTKTTTRVSVASNGAQFNFPSRYPSMSADGRFVTFLAELVPRPFWVTELYLHDMVTGETMRIDHPLDPTEDGACLDRSAMTPDGRFVTFVSYASTLVPGDTNFSMDIFVLDRTGGQTTRVSVASDGTEANASSDQPSISADGRYVAFRSHASNLVPDDTNGVQDVFVHDRQTGQTTRASVASDGTQGTSIFIVYPSISADGRYVVFESDSSEFVTGDTNNASDIFVHDQQTGETTRVSVAPDGTQGDVNRSSLSPAISADGRYVVFSSSANLVPGYDLGGARAMIIKDRQTGETAGVGMEPMYPAFSGDAAYVAYVSSYFEINEPPYLDDVWVASRSEAVGPRPTPTVPPTQTPSNPGNLTVKAKISRVAGKATLICTVRSIGRVLKSQPVSAEKATVIDGPYQTWKSKRTNSKGQALFRLLRSKTVYYVRCHAGDASSASRKVARVKRGPRAS